MYRPVILVFLVLVLPLAACVLLQSNEVDAPSAIPSFETQVATADVITADTTPAVTLTPEQWAKVRQVQELELRLELVSLELALAIVDERAPNTALNPESLNEAFSAMFEKPLDPTSAVNAEWYKEFEAMVADLGLSEVVLHQTTAEDPVFAKHPSAKKEWRSAHVFIRVEKTPKDGKKKSYGIILSAPEPEESDEAESGSVEAPASTQAAQ